VSDRTRAFQAMAQALRRSARARDELQTVISERLRRPPASPGAAEFLAAYRELSAASRRLHDRLGADDPLTLEMENALAHARHAWNGLLVDFPREAPGTTRAAQDTWRTAQDTWTAAPPASRPGAGDSGSRAVGDSAPDGVGAQRTEPQHGGITDDLTAGTVDEPLTVSDASASETAEPGPTAAAPQPSLELVPVGTRAVATHTRRSRYPDEATLVRYFRRRRERRRLPDESTIGRYLRERRERGPRYPDEAAIARYFRERRERF